MPRGNGALSSRTTALTRIDFTCGTMLAGIGVAVPFQSDSQIRAFPGDFPGISASLVEPLAKTLPEASSRSNVILPPIPKAVESVSKPILTSTRPLAAKRADPLTHCP